MRECVFGSLGAALGRDRRWALNGRLPRARRYILVWPPRRRVRSGAQGLRVAPIDNCALARTGSRCRDPARFSPPPKPARNLLRRRWPADTSIQSMRLFKRVHGFLLLAPACSRCTRLFRLRSSRCEIASTKIQLAPSSSDKSVMLFTLGVFPLRNRRKNSADRTEIPGKISWEKKISDYAGKLDSAHKVCIRSTVSIPRGLHAPRYP